MRRLTTALVALLLCLPALATDKPPVQTPALANMPPDGWGGRNAHVGYSAVIGAVSNALLPDRPWLASGLCLLVGVVKEAKDYRKGQPGYRHGLFSRNDLKADAAGCALGYLGFRFVKEF